MTPNKLIFSPRESSEFQVSLSDYRVSTVIKITRQIKANNVYYIIDDCKHMSKEEYRQDSNKHYNMREIQIDRNKQCYQVPYADII